MVRRSAVDRREEGPVGTKNEGEGSSPMLLREGPVIHRNTQMGYGRSRNLHTGGSRSTKMFRRAQKISVHMTSWAGHSGDSRTRQRST